MRSRPVSRSIFLAFFSLISSNAAQQPAVDAALTCRVVADDGTAVARATVRITGSDGPGVRIGVTDSAGEVVFASLPAGSFSISANKVGYVTAYYGSKQPAPSVPVALSTGQRQMVTLTMYRGAAISGWIFDSNGKPMPQVSVQAIPLRSVPRLVVESGAFVTKTDSRGSYRIFGLAPAEYFLMATPLEVVDSATVATNAEVSWALRQLSPPSQVGTQPLVPSGPSPSSSVSVKYCPMYFPGTTSVDTASRITLSPGEDRTGVTFALQLTRTATVTGRVVTSNSQSVDGTQLALVPDQGSIPAGLSDPSIRRFQSSGGSFSVTGVVPGRYTLYARWDSSVAERLSGPSSRTLWGKVDIQVGQDLSDVVVSLELGAALKGSVGFDPRSQAAKPDIGNVRVALFVPEGVPPLMGTLLTSVDAEGRFSFPSVIPWKYGIRIAPDVVLGPDRSSWILQTAVTKVGDLADSRVELRSGESVEAVVTLTSPGSEITGVLMDDAGRRTAEFAVVILGADRAFWTLGSRRVRSAQPATDGTFRLAGLPAGEYDIVAVADLDKSSLADAAYLEQLQAIGLRLTLKDGEKRTLNLKIGGR